MLTRYRVLDENDAVIKEGVTPLRLMQDQKGLHVVANIEFRATTQVTVDCIEIDIGRRTWIEALTKTLEHDDSIDWTLDVYLTDT